MPRESNLNRGRRRYSVKDHAQLNGESKIGSHVIKRSANCSYWKPSWNKTKTCIRVYPGLDPDDPSKTDVFRVSSDYNDFGDWVRTYPAVRNFGDPGITMLLYDPANTDVYNVDTNPCSILYRAIESACKAGQGKPEWYPLREYTHGRGRILSKPTQLGLVQCAIFCHNNKDFCENGSPPKGGAPEDRPVVFELSISAVKTLFDMLEKKEEDWKGEPDDPRQYQYGDIVSFDQGAYVWLFEKGTDVSVGGTKKEAPRTAFGGSRKTGPSGNDQEFRGFDCLITQEYNGIPADIPEELEPTIKEKIKPWDEIIQFYTDDEQAHLLNGCFPASAVLFAFRDHPEWIDSTTKRLAVGTKQVDMRRPRDEKTEQEATRPSGGSWGSRPSPAQSRKQQEEADDEEYDDVLEEDDKADIEQDNVVPPDDLPEEDDQPKQEEELVDFPPKDDEDAGFDEKPPKRNSVSVADASLSQAKARADSRRRRK